MEKILYYVVSKQLQTVGDIEETTGYKEVTVYEIIENKPTKFIDLEVENCEISETAIQEWLDDNGYGDDAFKFVAL